MPETTTKSSTAPAAAPTGAPPVPQAALPKGGPTTKPEKRSDAMPVGIPGAHMEEVDREVPGDAPPPWPINEKLNVVGKPMSRLDGRAKVTGAAKYTADI